MNFLAKRGRIEPGSESFGRAFENWVLHELAAYAQYSEAFHDLSHWRLTSGVEVDFVVDDTAYAVEAKASAAVHADHLKGLREIVRDYPKLKKRFVVSLDPRPRVTDDGIEILPYRAFTERLWAGDLFR